MAQCQKCDNDVPDYKDKAHCEDCNNKLAQDIHNAFANCKLLPKDWTPEVINMGNVNIDVRVFGPKITPYIFYYYNVNRMHKKIDSIGVDEFAKSFISNELSRRK